MFLEHNPTPGNNRTHYPLLEDQILHLESNLKKMYAKRHFYMMDQFINGYC